MSSLSVKRQSLPALLLAVFTLAGCAVGPDYKPPTVPMSSSFQGAEALNERAGAPTPELSQWWTGFNDPVLNRVVTTALAQNLTLAQATARVAQAHATTRAARAALLPAGQMNVQAAAAHQSLEDPLGRVENSQPGFDRNSPLYQASAGVSWEIDVFGGLRRSAEAAQADYQAAQASSVAARLSVIAETADTYVLVRTVQARLALAKDQTTTQQRRVDLAQLRYSRGVAPELELRQAQGELATTAANVPVFETALVSARNGLDILMGIEPGTADEALDSPRPIPQPPGIQTADGPASLLRRRPDIIVAERHLAASNARIGQAIAGYYPTISLSALVGSATTVASNVFTGDAALAQGVAGLRWRLFDFGTVDAEVQAAKGKNAEALAAYRLSVLQATADVEDAFSLVVKREARERQLALGETALQRALASALAAYQSGSENYLQVLDADDRLQRVQDERIVAQSDAARAAVASFLALGGGWDE
ncbi:efflux transporter outer membrane subunit [Caballeronia sp. HLA56]